MIRESLSYNKGEWGLSDLETKRLRDKETERDLEKERLREGETERRRD